MAVLEEMRARAETLMREAESEGGGASKTSTTDPSREGEVLEAVVVGSESAAVVSVLRDKAAERCAASGYMALRRERDFEEIAVHRRGSAPWRKGGQGGASVIRLRTAKEAATADELVGVVWAPAADETLYWSSEHLTAEAMLCCPIRDGTVADFDAGHAAWCASQGFEYVYLGDDDDDGPARLVDALAEAAATVADARKKTQKATTAPVPKSELSVTAIAGAGAEAVSRRLRGEDDADDVLCVDTKYYSARVRVIVVGPDDDPPAAADAIVLLADAVDRADALWRRFEFDAAPQTKVLISTDDALDAWCLDNGFERVTTDDHPDAGFPRLRQALDCTLWSNMDRKSPASCRGAPVAGKDRDAGLDRKSPASCPGAPVAGKDRDAGPPDDDDPLDIASELDELMAIVQAARDGDASDGDRREKAASVALRLARSLGIDDDDDDDADD